MAATAFEKVIRVHAKVAAANQTTQATPEQLAVRQPKILIIGCGGTGGWVVPHAARLVKSLGVGSLVIADGDTVEPKNLGRQNFVHADLGENKAIALAKRYSGAFGIPIRAIPGMLEDVRGLIRQSPEIILGCVDTHAGRRTIAEYMSRSPECVWIDAGNESVAGQVVCGYTGRNVGSTAMNQAGPSLMAMPTISQMCDLPVGGAVRRSCAEMAEITEQVSTVNLAAASLVINFLRLVLEDVKRVQVREPVKGLEFSAVFFNCGNGGYTTTYNSVTHLGLSSKPMCPWKG